MTWITIDGGRAVGKTTKAFAIKELFEKIGCEVIYLGYNEERYSDEQLQNKIIPKLLGKDKQNIAIIDDRNIPLHKKTPLV